jgi:hypothetical protein
VSVQFENAVCAARDFQDRVSADLVRAASGAPTMAVDPALMGIEMRRATEFQAAKSPAAKPGSLLPLRIRSAEDAGCIDDTSCRKQPNGDQKKFHDLPPRRA